MTFDFKFPVHKVFDRWVDVNHWSDWAWSMGKVEPLSDGPIHVGTKFKVFGRSVKWNCTVSEYQDIVNAYTGSMSKDFFELFLNKVMLHLQRITTKFRYLL